ncbi:MAG: BACON domain-containing protein [Alistipes sp.]|nr:BACON domain-containing protein [Alistipes sp.]
MRRFIFMLFVAVSLFAMSCEPKDAPEQEVEFQITSDTTVTMAAEGGTFVIAYTISGDDYNNVVAEADDTDIINNINTNQKGYILVSVSANESYSERSAAVRITYGEHSAIIRVNQAARVVNYEVVNIAANQLVGKYYGDNIKEGVGHYWIILTKDGFVDGAAVAGGEYFRLDLLAPMPKDESNVRIPDGEYRFDLSQNYEEFTIIDIGNTDYSWVDDQMEGWAQPLADASLSVAGNRFELVAVVDSTEYHVVFEGDYSLTTSVITDHVSSLTQDAVIDVSNCSASVASYGDYWDCGYNNWCIEFVCRSGMKNGTYLVIDFLSNSTTDFTGTYVDSGFSAEDETKPNFRPGVFVPGFRVADDADLLLGSLYMVYKDGLCVSQAPLYEGTVTIEANGNGTYTIVIDALDDAPEQNRITLNWTGRFE